MLKGNINLVQIADSQHSPPQYCFPGYGGVKEGGKKLCEFIDPVHKLDVGEGPQHPLIVLIFDKSHILTNTPKKLSLDFVFRVVSHFARHYWSTHLHPLPFYSGKI